MGGKKDNEYPSGNFSNSNLRYLHNANRFPGKMEAGVEQEGESKCQSSVPVEKKHHQGPHIQQLAWISY